MNKYLEKALYFYLKLSVECELSNHVPGDPLYGKYKRILTELEYYSRSE